MPTEPSLRSEKLRNRTSWIALVFGVIVLLAVGYVAGQEDLKQLFVFLAAIVGSAAGLLYSTLDHGSFTLKAKTVIESDLMQNAYISLRVSIPTAIGYGASYVAFIGSDETLLKQSALAFAAAYIVDAGKLIAK